MQLKISKKVNVNAIKQVNATYTKKYINIPKKKCKCDFNQAKICKCSLKQKTTRKRFANAA